MNAVFADTSGLYAILDRSDENHAKAASVFPELIRENVLITNNYVLVETAALIQFRLGMAAVRLFATDVLPVLTVEWVTGRQHYAAWEALLTASRRKLSFVDCVSFQTMRDCGLRTAFCFDAHFREQGFETLP